MSDLINKTVEALNAKQIGTRAPNTQEEFLNTINATARALDKTPLRQGSNQFNKEIAQDTYNDFHGITKEEKEVPKTANVRERLERVDISKDLIAGAVEKLNKKSIIAP
jgi:hypothetical protein